MLGFIKSICSVHVCYLPSITQINVRTQNIYPPIHDRQGSVAEKNKLLIGARRNKYIAASLGNVFGYVARYLQLSSPAGFCTLRILQLTCRDFRNVILHSGRAWASKTCLTADPDCNKGFVKMFGLYIHELDVSNVKSLGEICALVERCPRLTGLLSRESIDRKMERIAAINRKIAAASASASASPICRMYDLAKAVRLGSDSGTHVDLEHMDRLLDILETRSMKRLLLANTAVTHERLYKFLLKVCAGVHGHVDILIYYMHGC